MSPLGLAFVAAAGVALLIAVLGGGLLAWRRARDPVLERRLRRVAAPLAGVTAHATGDDQASIFRTAEKQSGFGRFIAAAYPLLDARSALVRAMAAGLAGAGAAWFSLWFLRLPSGWWTFPAIGAAGAGVAWYEWAGCTRGERRNSCGASPRWWTR